MWLGSSPISRRSPNTYANNGGGGLYQNWAHNIGSIGELLHWVEARMERTHTENKFQLNENVCPVHCVPRHLAQLPALLGPCEINGTLLH